MTYPDPTNPKHWIYNPDGTRTAKPNVEFLKDLVNDPTPKLTVINNNNNYNMGDNGIVQLGNGTIITNPNPAKKSILSRAIDHLITHIVKWLVGLATSIVLAVIANWL